MTGKLYAGLDVALETTAACVMDQDGHLVREVKVRTRREALAATLASCDGHFSKPGAHGSPSGEEPSAKVALARKISIALHRMWVNETELRYSSQQATAAI